MGNIIYNNSNKEYIYLLQPYIVIYIKITYRYFLYVRSTKNKLEKVDIPNSFNIMGRLYSIANNV